jgi:uncharacterized membrane protein YedE/YeeE
MLSGVLVAVVVGLALGFFLQKGRFCFVHAFRDLFAFKDTRVTKGVLVAIVLTMLGWSVAYQLGYYQGFWTPDWGLTGLVGGFVFGVGMTYAGGCASGTLYRAGQGYLHFWLTLLFMGVGYVAFAFAFSTLETLYLEPLTFGEGTTLFEASSLPAPLLAVVASGAIVLTYAVVVGHDPAKGDPTEPAEAGTDDPVRSHASSLLAPVAGGRRAIDGLRRTATGTRTYLRGFREIDDYVAASRKPWDPRTAALGITAAAMLWFAHVSIVGVTGPEARWSGYLLSQVGVDVEGVEYWGSVLFAGEAVSVTADMIMIAMVIAGAGIAALWSGDFSVRMPKRRRVPNAVLGGFCMGAGSRLAPGCNIGNIYSGVASLSVHSFVAAIGIVLGVYVMTHWLYREVGCAI